MIRGTTPTVVCTVPFDPSVLDKLWITFSGNGREIFTLEKDDCTFVDNDIKATLTQAQTLMLKGGSYVEIQIRALTDDGVAIASNILKEPVWRILKDGEI